MSKTFFAVILISVLTLSGCARYTANGGSQQLVADAELSSASTQVAISATDITGFIDSAVTAQLSEKEQAEAASAQYYALQFGRPGAPRRWQGDKGASGRVSVGPYVRVNTLDCRDFSHLVTVETAIYEQKGTACRETDGSWTVVDS